MIIGNGPYYVYAHINKTNGKMYIGISKRDNPNQRWKNGKGYNYNWHFRKAIEKYGWNGFFHEIVASNLTEQEASNMERMLIEKLETTNRDKGYNFAEGGYNNRGLKGELNPFFGKVPVKAVEASIKARAGKSLSKDHIEKIRQGNIRAGANPNSLKALQDWQNKKKNNPKGAKNHKSIAVLCVETNIIYESQHIAENELKIARGSIYQAIKNNIRAGGYHWKRV